MMDDISKAQLRAQENKVIDEKLMRFEAPIPGSSLTTTPGGAPYEKPPQFTDLDKAANYIFDKLVTPRQSARLIALVKAGAPLESIANTILFEGFSKGKWSPDMALLLLQPVLLQVGAIIHRASKKGLIKQSQIKVMNPDKETDDFLSELAIRTEEVAEEEEVSKIEKQIPKGGFFALEKGE